ncbi:MAG TPA: iron-sulfur cluster assembly protein [Membranihabitans sp.]|nr:iron-sulfur cluster assembly protein [Membranihabitans sp.]
MSTLKDKIIDVLRTVEDPEIPVNIYELGLVYDITIKEDNVVFIVMTLTAPACPVAGQIVMDVQQKVSEVEGIGDVHVDLTFDPPWTMDMMSEEAKLELDFM